MNNRRVLFGFLRAMLLITIAIVGSLYFPSASAAPALPVVARLHWLGLNQISADTNSATVMKIWHLPETAALERQTLDKLSGWLAGGTNAASARLRPLLDDFVTSEFNLEIRAATNAPASGSASSSVHRDCQWLLAIHLPADRMLFWQTNLAVAVADLTGAQALATPHGWRIRRPQSPEEIEFYRQGDWGVIEMGQRIPQSLPQHYIDLDLNSQFRFRDWVDADLDIPRIAQNSTFCNGNDHRDELRSFGPLRIFQFLSLFAKHCHLTVDGKNGTVSSRGTLTLLRSMEKPLPDWQIPTNLIGQPLSCFTVARGFSSWLSKLSAWHTTGIETVPDQAVFWTQSGVPFLSYFTAPLPMASNQLFKLAGRLVERANPWLARHGEGSFVWSAFDSTIVWKRALMLSPYLKTIAVGQNDSVLGGLVPLAKGDLSVPSPLMKFDSNSSELIYYQSEQTGTQLEGDLFTDQLFRVVFHKAQLPAQAPGTRWLKTVGPLLGVSVTSAMRTSSRRLAFNRESAVGFSALELEFIVDWLESPAFPIGLHTFAVPPVK